MEFNDLRTMMVVIVTDVEDGGHGDATHVHDQQVADLMKTRLVSVPP